MPTSVPSSAEKVKGCVFGTWRSAIFAGHHFVVGAFGGIAVLLHLAGVVVIIGYSCLQAKLEPGEL